MNHACINVVFPGIKTFPLNVKGLNTTLFSTVLGSSGVFVSGANSWRARHGITDKRKPLSYLYKNRIHCPCVLLSGLDSLGPISLLATKINVVFID